MAASRHPEAIRLSQKEINEEQAAVEPAEGAGVPALPVAYDGDVVVVEDAAALAGPALSEGEHVAGKYRLRKLLARGGMGDVWRAHNETLDIDVALKVIRREFGGTEASDRLLREAQAAARLGHPAIVRIFDFGVMDSGEPFIVMELLEGEDLATALEKRGRLSATKAVRTLLPIAHALLTAHARGIVHRDLKPENILLAQMEGTRAQPKIVDFGIAKVDRAKGLRLTQDGALLGSPAYMSPEQARGDDVDQRGDVWAFCVVLYELVTGRQPFEGRNHHAILHAIVATEPPPITTLAAGDDELWAILATGLAKDPDRRWHSMKELAEALVGWLLARGATEDITGAKIEATWGVALGDPKEQRPTSAPPPGPRSDSASEVTLPPGQVRAPGGRLRRAALFAGIVGGLAVLVASLARMAPSGPVPAPVVGSKAPDPAERRPGVAVAPAALPAARAPETRAPSSPSAVRVSSRPPAASAEPVRPERAKKKARAETASRHPSAGRPSGTLKDPFR